MIIEEINENMLFINADIVDQEKLKKYIINEKVKRINNGFQLSLDDLVLIRSIEEEMFPINGYYYPLNEDNCYKGTMNPFDYFFQSIKYGYDSDYVGGDVFNHKEEDTYVYYPVYRDTKHFTVNALSSNVSRMFMPSIIFNDRPIIIIEPMKERIDNGLLVNLNPVDTFFDLHDTCMKVSDNAILLIGEDKYKELIEKDEYKKMLNTHKIYLFRGEPKIACDIVLLHSGILPQHSIGQRELIEEEYRDGDNFISDKKYLSLFRHYIEYLNQEYLNASYIHLPKDIIKSRKKYEHMYPGLLHDNTTFRDEEKNYTMNYIISAYAEYMEYLSMFANAEFKEKKNNMINLIENDVKEKYPYIRFTFMELHDQYGSIMQDFLKDIKYDRFISLTQKFNEKQLSRIDKKRIG